VPVGSSCRRDSPISAAAFHRIPAALASTAAAAAAAALIDRCYVMRYNYRVLRDDNIN